ncbi:hypothetical protein [Mucilaginibacter sp. NFR10]|uniref:hypothetical protein n=1 Tax=Mucilaginibacter sp. NFR10 TaxID=1566292 RepID=UPI0008715E30|nr:hypothetical protein [Mucilaginibacter sp. NFR10]SCW61814.1 putative endopeptidase [Mucilaginibacter sp. NFR10]
MKLKFNCLLLAACLGMSVNAFAIDGPKPVKPRHKTSAPPKKFIDPANMDLSVKPGDDFFEYANGGWLKQNGIPC